MSTMLNHLALVSESNSVSADSLMVVAAALQKQIVRDFGPIWGVNATIAAYPKLEDVPVDYWKILVIDNIDQEGAAGVHLDDQGQPFALVTADSNQDVWSLTASHECLEMLADPFGNRLIAGDSPMEGQGRVQILVEVSDPSEDASFGYTVNGVLVADFYTPNFFDPIAADSVRYSFTGAISEPRQVLKGGYLSWVDPTTNDWWQETWFDGDAPAFRNIGPLSAKAGSFRSQIDAKTQHQTARAMQGGRRSALAAGHPTSVNQIACSARADALRKCIQELMPPGTNTSTATGKPQARAARRVKPGD
jgi:hypothetical protein